MISISSTIKKKEAATTIKAATTKITLKSTSKATATSIGGIEKANVALKIRLYDYK